MIPSPHWNLIGSRCSIVPPLHCWKRQILPRDPSPPRSNLMVYLTPLIQTTTWPLGHHTPPYSIQGLQPIKHVSWGMLGARQYLCRRPRGRKKCECRVHLKTDKLQWLPKLGGVIWSPNAKPGEPADKNQLPRTTPKSTCNNRKALVTKMVDF